MDESECQSVVNKWAKLYGYDDPPKVVFTSYALVYSEENEIETPAATILPGDEGPEIEININLPPRSELEMLWTLGHEFAHWLQFKEGRQVSQFMWKEAEFQEKEADEIGMKLAKNEIISRASQLPLEF